MTNKLQAVFCVKEQKEFIMELEEIDAHSKQRIGYIHDKKSLDRMLTAFEQDFGIPMGADDWPDRVINMMRRMRLGESLGNEIRARLDDLRKLVVRYDSQFDQIRSVRLKLDEGNRKRRSDMEKKAEAEFRATQKEGE